MTTLWDTTGSNVVKALGAERRSAGALAFGLALTLVVVVDEQHVAEAEEAATTAAAAHPCRLLVVVRRQIDSPTPRLDAEVSIGGRLGPGEAVVMRMYGRLALHAESVVLPLLAPDAPVVTWWHGEPPDRIAYDPLGVFADRRVTDTTAAPDPVAALRQRAVDYVPGDVDLAWTRTTPWRTLLAAAYDQVTEQATGATVVSAEHDPSAHLVAGWLRSRLGVPVGTQEVARRRQLASIRIDIGDGKICLDRKDSRTAELTLVGGPQRVMPLADRDLGDLLAEELRRLDVDATYSDALSAWSGIPGLSARPTVREHVWRDPMAPAAANGALAATAAPSSGAATDSGSSTGSAG
ncbi:MAG: glucose-6-phosphate dehydrogenase assembly protein OpcA [Frankia sp.]